MVEGLGTLFGTLGTIASSLLQEESVLVQKESFRSNWTMWTFRWLCVHALVCAFVVSDRPCLTGAKVLYCCSLVSRLTAFT